MLLIAIVGIMILVASMGKSSSRISTASYLMIFLFSFIQVVLILVYVYNTEMPPLL